MLYDLGLCKSCFVTEGSSCSSYVCILRCKLVHQSGVVKPCLDLEMRVSGELRRQELRRELGYLYFQLSLTSCGFWCQWIVKKKLEAKLYFLTFVLFSVVQFCRSRYHHYFPFPSAFSISPPVIFVHINTVL